MKIAFVHDWLTGFAGAEQILLALHEMYPEAPIYTSLYNPEKVPQFKDAKVISSYLQKLPGLKNRHQVSIPLMPLAFESFNLKGFDVVVSIGGGLSKGVITQPNQRHISYCNTPIRYIWHLGGDTRTDGWLRSRVAHTLRIWDFISSSRPDTYIANSENIARRIQKIYRKPSVVIYPPVNTERFLKVSGESQDYFLSVCRLISYKRVDLLVKAAIEGGFKLKVVGTGPEEGKLKELAKGNTNIEFLGRVSDEELSPLYGGAKAFLFAAEEDFGLVPIEAMSAGRAVIAYSKGGVLESVKDGETGVFFKEQTSGSILGAIARFSTKTWDSNTIRKHALQFDKKHFQQQMKEIIEGKAG